MGPVVNSENCMDTCHTCRDGCSRILDFALPSSTRCRNLRIVSGLTEVEMAARFRAIDGRFWTGQLVREWEERLLNTMSDSEMERLYTEAVSHTSPSQPTSGRTS